MAAFQVQAQYVALVAGKAGLISNANGSPCISTPILPFSPEDLAAQLVSLTAKTKDGQIASKVNGLQLSKQQMEAKTAEGIAKIKEWQANTIEAAAKTKKAAEQSWFEKICNAIVGVVLAVVTAPLVLTGVGAPLFAMAVGMAIDSVTACENNSRALETPPREPLESPGNPLSLMGTAILKQCGVDPEEAKMISSLTTAVTTMLVCPAALLLNPGIMGTIVSDSMKIELADKLAEAKKSGDPAKVQAIENEIYKAEMITTIVTTVVVAIAGIVATAASGGAAAGMLLSDFAKISMAAGEIAAASVNIAKSGMAIETSKLQLSAAESTRDASHAQADAAKIDAKKLMIQKFMEESQGDMKKLLQELMDNATLVSQMINSAGSTRSTISANLSAPKFNPA